MNSAVTAYGLTCGGNAGGIGELPESSGRRRCLVDYAALDRMIGPGSLDYSPGWILMDMLSRVWSPSDEPRELSPTSRDPEEPDRFRYTEPIGQDQAFRVRQQRDHFETLGRGSSTSIEQRFL